MKWCACWLCISPFVCLAEVDSKSVSSRLTSTLRSVYYFTRDKSLFMLSEAKEASLCLREEVESWESSWLCLKKHMVTFKSLQVLLVNKEKIKLSHEISSDPSVCNVKDMGCCWSRRWHFWCSAGPRLSAGPVRVLSEPSRPAQPSDQSAYQLSLWCCILDLRPWNVKINTC